MNQDDEHTEEAPAVEVLIRDRSAARVEKAQRDFEGAARLVGTFIFAERGGLAELAKLFGGGEGEGK